MSPQKLVIMLEFCGKQPGHTVPAALRFASANLARFHRVTLLATLLRKKDLPWKEKEYLFKGDAPLSALSS